MKKERLAAARETCALSSEGARPTWVSVADEPLHRVLFTDGRIRIYEAAIAPGEETAFHRHDRGTLYAVVAGGRSTTEALPGAPAGSYRFPRTTRWNRLLMLGMTRTLFGWTELPAGAWFIMPARRQPAIHRVRASRANRFALRMLGVEIVPQEPFESRRDAGAPEPGRPDYEDDSMRVRELPPGGVIGPGCDGLIVVVTGDFAVAEGGGDGKGRALHAGDFLRFDPGAVITIRERSDACLALLVEIK